MTDRYSYLAFGEDLSSTGSTVNEFRYVGEQWDVNAGFYYHRARWYSPSIGRFTSVDPFAGDKLSPVSLHRYLYGNASPVMLSDPSGNFTILGVLTTVAISSALASFVVPSFKGFVWEASGRTDNFGLQFVAGGYGGHILAGGMLGAYIWEEPSTDGTYFGRKQAYFNVWLIGLGEGIAANVASSEVHFHRPHNRKSNLKRFSGLGRLTTVGFGAGGVSGSLGTALQMPEGTYIQPAPGISLEVGVGASGIVALVLWQLRGDIETLWE